MEGIAGVLGALIGVMGTMGVTWLNHYLSVPKEDVAEKAAKDLLTSMLQNPQWNWRSMKSLANVIGTDEATTRRYLLKIGARGSENNGEFWGLVSRNPIKGPDALVSDPVL
jgi:hypothetical protein